MSGVGLFQLCACQITTFKKKCLLSCRAGLILLFCVLKNHFSYRLKLMGLKCENKWKLSLPTCKILRCGCVGDLDVMPKEGVVMALCVGRVRAVTPVFSWCK